MYSELQVQFIALSLSSTRDVTWWPRDMIKARRRHLSKWSDRLGQYPTAANYGVGRHFRQTRQCASRRAGGDRTLHPAAPGLGLTGSTQFGIISLNCHDTPCHNCHAPSVINAVQQDSTVDVKPYGSETGDAKQDILGRMRIASEELELCQRNII